MKSETEEKTLARPHLSAEMETESEGELVSFARLVKESGMSAFRVRLALGDWRHLSPTPFP